jgi:hypothetical protein
VQRNFEVIAEPKIATGEYTKGGHRNNTEEEIRSRRNREDRAHAHEAPPKRGVTATDVPPRERANRGGRDGKDTHSNNKDHEDERYAHAGKRNRCVVYPPAEIVARIAGGDLSTYRYCLFCWQQSSARTKLPRRRLLRLNT